MNQNDGPSEWVPLSRQLPEPVLMLVTDRRAAGGEDELVWIIQQAVEGGVNVVQLREKDMDPFDLTDLADRVKDAVGERAVLLINTSTEAALETGADGVHLPENARFDRPTEEMIIGRSVHSADAAKRAEAQGADYVVVGTVYETDSHPGVAPSGVGLVADSAAAVSIPVIAIGGIRADRVPEVMAAGAAGVAVKSAIIAADDPLAAARALSTAMAGAAAGGKRSR
jgi:thiamine-phosphate pyrophosphorylase